MGALDGRVAVITGAGRGIGREHALLFAREGAKVVVNDLDEAPAREVASEIGMVASSANIAEWAGARALVDQAVAEFGRLDIVVNNAGMLRDAFLAGITESQWDEVISVHLKGHAAVLHHAAAYWKAESKAGRQPVASVVNTCSASGTTVPNPGQSNYGAAKAGIAALTLVAAAELERYGVRVNAIAPIARTRLTLATPGMGAIFAADVPDGELDLFDPVNIAPLVAYLATEKCAHTGQVFAVQGGSIQRLRGWTVADTVETMQAWTIASVESELATWE